MSRAGLPAVKLGAAALALALATLCAVVPPARAEGLEAFLAAAPAPAALEAEIVRRRAEAEAAGTARPFWDEFRAAFQASRPETLRLVARWREEAPGSAHAKAAEALLRRHLAGLAPRVGAPLLPGHPEEPAAAAHRSRAAVLAMQVLEADPGVLPAYWLARDAQREGGIPWTPGPLIEALLTRDPSRAAMRDAFATYIANPPDPYRPARSKRCSSSVSCMPPEFRITAPRPAPPRRCCSPAPAARSATPPAK